MKKLIFFKFIFILGLFKLQAQTNFISAYPSVNVLTASEFVQYQKIENFSKFSNVNLVQLNSLSSSINENGNLQIDLNGDECGFLEFEPKTSRYIDDQNYYYYAILLDPNVDPNQCICTCVEGEIMIESRDGRKYGHILIDETKYEVLSLGSTYSVIGKMNPTFPASKSECNPTSSQGGQGLKVPNLEPTARTGGCDIRVLFLYTQKAEDAFGIGGITDMSYLSISQTNQAFSNSKISPTNTVRANLRKLEGFNETQNNIEGDLLALRTSSQVASWRSTDLADVVVLITDAGYPGFHGFTPIENLSNPQANFAFGLIEGNSININFTFTHELGHLIGCHHQRCGQHFDPNCDDTGGYEHAYFWKRKPCWLCSYKIHNSMLHTLETGIPRELHFSNPNVNHRGQPTGTELNDNAKWINTGHGCFVSNYITQEPIVPLDGEINGDDRLCKPLTGQYGVFASGSGSPYSYQWHISQDGVNWGSIYSTNQVINVNSLNYLSNKYISIRVKISNTLGDYIYRFYFVLIVPKTSTSCTQNLISSNNDSHAKTFPNPVKDELAVELDIEKNSTQTTIEIMNTIGTRLFLKEKIYPSGIYYEKINTGNLPSLFFTKITIAGKTSIHKNIKIE
jgi:hypothetical protein